LGEGRREVGRGGGEGRREQEGVKSNAPETRTAHGTTVPFVVSVEPPQNQVGWPRWEKKWVGETLRPGQLIE
jgi:hypothetical protein